MQCATILILVLFELVRALASSHVARSRDISTIVGELLALAANLLLSVYLIKPQMANLHENPLLWKKWNFPSEILSFYWHFSLSSSTKA